VGTYYYYVAITLSGSSCVQLVSNLAEVNVVADPVISSSALATQTQCQNTTATNLTVQVTGGMGTISYQWYSNTTNSTTGGVLISGATASSYSPSTAMVGTQYYYVVVTQNFSGCSVTSAVSTVIVVSTPSITTQPVSNTVCKDGTTPALTIAYFNGAGTPTYQWYKNTINSTTGGTPISGATVSSYTPLTNVVGTTYYYATVNFSGGCSLITSNTAAIIVNSTIIPTFTQVADVNMGATMSPLPTTSTNGITGTWSPALNNMVTTTYTFTPAIGQCASTASMTIIVIPVYTQVQASQCDITLPSLTTTINANAFSGATGYRFEVTDGSTLRIFQTVNRYFNLSQLPGVVSYGTTYSIRVAIQYNSVWQPYGPSCIVSTNCLSPTFTQVPAICSGGSLAALPTTSTNGITGTWSPALNTSATTTYTFTPSNSLCSTTASMTITVNPNVIPAFTQVAPICFGVTINSLPTTSTNGITGTWSPELNNTATTTYTFTPTVGQCANTTTMTIVVNDSYYTFYVDADGDGIGAGAEVYGCLDEYGNLPPGYSSDNYDCNDNDANFLLPSNWYGNVYIDADGDGFGSGNPTSTCMSWDYNLPQGYSWNNYDCDDHFFSSNGLCPLTLNIKLYLQGYYKSNQNQMTPLRKNARVSPSQDEVDEVTVSLYSKYDVINPIIAAATAVVGTNGIVGLKFAVLPDEYYILVEHKNTIKTWSATPVAITNGTTYDFTTAASQAYGNNQIEVASGIYAIYSGDMNQDGTINEADLPIFTIANTTAAHGYVVSDLNGDGSVDLLDYPIYKNNAAASVNAVRPVPLPIASLPNVTIGTQVWQSTNLNVATYRDGTPIPQVTDPTAWANLTTGAWCYYNNTIANDTTYGKLYNWYAVAGIHDNDPNTPNKILAPEGWHVPTDAEWTKLTTFLGGDNVAGGKMKATGTSLWLSPNTGATNSSSFTGLPAGCRLYGGTFGNGGAYCDWWSSSESEGSTTSALNRYLGYGNGNAWRGSRNKGNGFSVRCLRD
jgi:uncharacterized protein (TIGR02145 family)